jgi:hypothetical protein
MKNHLFCVEKIGVAAMAVFFVAVMASVARADDLVVSPAVIDGHGAPNDILNYTLVVTNTTGNQKNVYASVYELTPSGTEPFSDPSDADRTSLLADWISVSRASMTFAPGASETIPVTIQVNPYAAAGNYHAVIAFVEGNTRPEAEEHLQGAPQALVDMAVASNLVASLRVDDFAPAKGFYAGFPVSFDYTIENNGTVSSTPSGEVRFYDRLGRELGSVDANPDGLSIVPGGKQSFAASWAKGGGFGQYTAILDVSYGGVENRLENTALVWVLPWEKLLFIFGSLLILVIAAALWLHRAYEKRHHRRRLAIERLIARSKAENKWEKTLDLRHPRHE